MAEGSFQKFQVVVAIDIGTTYSGYAFSLKSDYDKDPMTISGPQCFVAGESKLLSHKTSSSLLLDKDKKFVSFGFDAETKYANAEKPDEKYFFHRFKMDLYKTKDISSKLQLEDITKKKERRVPAIDVFSLSIRALKDAFLNHVKLKNLTVALVPENILWVITVPAIWPPSAKIFMVESAKKAEINENQLCIALEPEAGAIFCQQKTDLNLSEPGTTYLVADLGGGTADITVHEKLPDDGRLKELHKADGIDAGGTDVDKKFFELFSELTETQNIQSVLSADSQLDLYRSIEILKRRINHEDDEDVTVEMPTLLTEEDERELKENIKELVLKYCKRHGQDIIKKRTGNKISFNAPLLKSFFYDTIDRIIHRIQFILDACKKSVDLILLVGGFSESTVVVQRIRDFFKHKTVIAPTDAGLAIVKGAVIYGYDNEIIMSRILTHSYGQDICREFDASKDEGRETITRDGRVYCVGVFDEIVAAGDEIKRGDEKTIVVGTLSDFQLALKCNFYACPNRTPDYVDDPDCTEIGSLFIPLLFPLPAGRLILLAIKFGGTVIEVTAIDEIFQIPIRTTLKLKD